MNYRIFRLGVYVGRKLICWWFGEGFVSILLLLLQQWSRILLGVLVLSLLHANLLLLIPLLFRFLLILTIALLLYKKCMALIAMSSFMTILLPSLTFATNSKVDTNVSILSKTPLLYSLPFATFNSIILIFFFFWVY